MLQVIHLGNHCCTPSRLPRILSRAHATSDSTGADANDTAAAMASAIASQAAMCDHSCPILNPVDTGYLIAVLHCRLAVNFCSASSASKYLSQNTARHTPGVSIMIKSPLC